MDTSIYPTDPTRESREDQGSSLPRVPGTYPCSSFLREGDGPRVKRMVHYGSNTNALCVVFTDVKLVYEGLKDFHFTSPHMYLFKM